MRAVETGKATLINRRDLVWPPPQRCNHAANGRSIDGLFPMHSTNSLTALRLKASRICPAAMLIKLRSCECVIQGSEFPVLKTL